MKDRIDLKAFTEQFGMSTENDTVVVPVVMMTHAVGLPEYKTPGSSGMDLQSATDEVLNPGSTMCLPTGIRIAVPEGYEIQVRSRSGLALKKSVFCLNSPGTVDADYRDEVGVILHNAGKEPFPIRRGDRIAQAVLCPVAKAALIRVDVLDETKRKGGFGSTGV